jgi:histidine ammonia-lyase
VSLARENQELAAPILDTFAMAGNIEDVPTNAPKTVQRVRTQINTLSYILEIEMMRAAQAIDLRWQKILSGNYRESLKKYLNSTDRWFLS